MPRINVAIEYDGLQHYVPIEHYGGEEGFANRLRNDDIKIRYCKDNDIKLVRIKDIEGTGFDKKEAYIHEILDNELSEYKKIEFDS